MEGGKPEKNPRSTGETNYITLPHMSSDSCSRNNTKLYPGGHPSSYNPDRPGLTSELSGQLTGYAIRTSLNRYKRKG